MISRMLFNLKIMQVLAMVVVLQPLDLDPDLVLQYFTPQTEIFNLLISRMIDWINFGAEQYEIKFDMLISTTKR